MNILYSLCLLVFFIDQVITSCLKYPISPIRGIKASMLMDNNSTPGANEIMSKADFELPLKWSPRLKTRRIRSSIVSEK